MRISDWSSDVCSSDLHNHKTDVLVNQIKGIGYPPKPDQRPDAQECKPAAQQGVETRRQNTADQKPVDPFREQQCGKQESKQWRLLTPCPDPRPNAIRRHHDCEERDKAKPQNPTQPPWQPGEPRTNKHRRAQKQPK